MTRNPIVRSKVSHSSVQRPKNRKNHLRKVHSLIRSLIFVQIFDQAFNQVFGQAFDQVVGQLVDKVFGRKVKETTRKSKRKTTNSDL